ncbi:MAG: aspartate-semialdehyde dehydrogenase [Candidatus Porifericomitaceae bacterium WSBS_2022_MAG_OTU9]
MPGKFNVAVVGATGAVGSVMLELLAQRRFPAAEIHAVAGPRSAGSHLSCGERNLQVQDLAQFNFKGIDIALFSAGSDISLAHAHRAVEAGAVVVDNTSAFRYQPDVPLVVPEVNPHALAGYSVKGMVANPNCSTIQMVVALKPLYDAAGIKRIQVCTWQAVSGAGRAAIRELRSQSESMLRGNNPPESGQVFPRPIAFNVLPQIDVFTENGYTKEEMKMVLETRKILENEDIAVSATAVRVPVEYGHSEAISIETDRHLGADEARKLLSTAAGVVVMDSREPGGWPTALTDAAGSDSVYVGRIRDDISHPNGLVLWVVSDNVRKGAALNSLQIAELLVTKYL